MCTVALESSKRNRRWRFRDHFFTAHFSVSVSVLSLSKGFKLLEKTQMQKIFKFLCTVDFGVSIADAIPLSVPRDLREVSSSLCLASLTTVFPSRCDVSDRIQSLQFGFLKTCFIELSHITDLVAIIVQHVQDDFHMTVF